MIGLRLKKPPPAVCGRAAPGAAAGALGRLGWVMVRSICRAAPGAVWVEGGWE